MALRISFIYLRLRSFIMKKIIVAIASILLIGSANAASISFTPASVSVARGAPSSDITVQVAGDFSSVYVEANANINLDAFSIYQIQSIGTNSCLLIGGKLRVLAAGNTTFTIPFPAAQTAVCRLKVRPRIAAGVGGYSLYVTDAYGYNAFANSTSVWAASASITVTP
jgi:hypothetical protein